MSPEPIRLAQIGCGYWGPNLIRSFTAQVGSHVKWVADVVADRRTYVETNYPKTKATASWGVALADPEVDAVIVATPASTHYELVKAALDVGKHVFVEKPLAMSTRQATELIHLAASRRRTLMVGDTFLYNAAVRYIKRLLASGELGEIYYIHSQRLNLGQVRTDVNAWWNLAPHDVSILLYLMDGELPVSVSVHGVDYLQPAIEDVAFGTLTWANRMTAHVHVSWLDPTKTRKMTLVGSRKMVVYDDVSDDKIAVVDKGVDRVPKAGDRMDYDYFTKYQLLHRTGDIVLPRIQLEEPLLVEAAHFLHCVRTGQTPLSGPRHAWGVVSVLEAGHQSLLAETAVPVRQEGTSHASWSSTRR